MAARRYFQAVRQALVGSAFEGSIGLSADAAATAAESAADRVDARPSRISARSTTVAATPRTTSSEQGIEDRVDTGLLATPGNGAAAHGSSLGS